MRGIVAVAMGIAVLAGSVSASMTPVLPLIPLIPLIEDQSTTADPWMTRTTKVQFQPQAAANAPLQLDLPKKDWMVLPSSGSVVLMFASRKGDAVVTLERSALREAIDAADITEMFAKVQIESIKVQQPKATEFLSRVLNAGPRRLIAVQYARPGVLGSERVRQYSLPVAKQLYLLTCISSAGEFASYDPVFSHIAASFAQIP